MRASTARVAIFFVALLVSASSGAAAALFPQPLHVTRQIDDPIAKSAVTIEEYCSADRIVSVRGDRTVIIDYASGQLTEIDRGGTYSITSFEELANARRMRSAAARVMPQLRAAGGRVAPFGHALTVFATNDGVRTIEIAIDDQVRLSRGAIEALIGAAYPNSRNETHDAILAAAQSGTFRAAAIDDIETTSGLPVAVNVTVENGAESLTLKNEIVAVDSRTAPPEALLIPPGAMRVESRLVRFAREADALDHPKGSQH